MSYVVFKKVDEEVLYPADAGFSSSTLKLVMVCKIIFNIEGPPVSRWPIIEHDPLKQFVPVFFGKSERFKEDNRSVTSTKP